MLFRYWRHGATRHVHPMTVVEDGPDWLVLWLAPQTPVVRAVLADGRDFRSAPVQERFTLPRVAQVGPWHGTGILKLVPRDAPYSVWLFWAADGDFLGWYGNLENRQHRGCAGGLRVVDTVDHVLDVWVPVAGEPRWKDEDEFEVTTGLAGYWTEAEAAVILAQGETLMDMARRHDPPFDQRWTGFRPDPGWTTAALPDGWDVPRPGLTPPSGTMAD